MPEKTIRPADIEKGESMTICDRCGKDTGVTVVSMFNTDVLCLECKRKERSHPDYDRAASVERTAVRAGDFNFPGIGKPSDL